MRNTSSPWRRWLRMYRPCLPAFFGRFRLLAATLTAVLCLCQAPADFSDIPPQMEVTREQQ